jgi:hypothetical protein
MLLTFKATGSQAVGCEYRRLARRIVVFLTNTHCDGLSGRTVEQTVNGSIAEAATSR